MYANAKDVSTAESLGYTHDSNTQRGSRFTNGVRHVWSTHRGWQTADLIDGRFTGHLVYAFLGDALARPLARKA